MAHFLKKNVCNYDVCTHNVCQSMKKSIMEYLHTFNGVFKFICQLFGGVFKILLSLNVSC